MAHHTRTTNTYEEALALEFDKVLWQAAEARSVEAVLDKLRVAQALRMKADNVGCDGDLIHENDSESHAVNIVIKLLDMLDDGSWMGISDPHEDFNEPMDSYDRQLMDEERALSMEKVA